MLRHAIIFAVSVFHVPASVLAGGFDFTQGALGVPVQDEGRYQGRNSPQDRSLDPQPSPAAQPTQSGESATSGTVAVAAPAQVAAEEVREYQIGANDLLEISVFQIPELSRTVRVNSRGMVSLPLIGAIQAGGKTGQELEDMLAQKLADGYLQDPQVSVFIKEYTSQRITIEGAVEKAGVYPITGRVTLLQAIAQAAGPNDVADYNAIKLIRPQMDGTNQMTLHDLEAIRDGKAVDPVLMGNDMIVVDKASGRAAIKDITNTLRGFFSFGTLR